MDGGQVKGAEALILELAMFDVCAITDNEFSNRVGKAGCIQIGHVALKQRELAALFGDYQIARMAGDARFLSAGNEKEMNRFLEHAARGDKNKSAVLEKGGVEGSKGVVLTRGITCQMLLNE